MKLNVAIDDRLDESIEVAAYYVVSESLANIGKHAKAKTVTIDVTREGDELVVEVIDDGIGALTASAGPAFAVSRTESRRRRPAARLDPDWRRHSVCAPRCRAVALAEDSVLLRDGLSRLLNDEGFEVVAQCQDAAELMRKLSAYEVDVVIVDIRLPPTHTDEGLRAALEIRESYPGTAVLVLSQYVELGLAMKLLSDSAEERAISSRTASATSRSSLTRSGVSERRFRDRPPDRLHAALPPARGRSARRAHRARARGARADGERQVQPRHRREFGDQRGAVEKYVSSIFAKLGLRPAPNRARSRGAAVPRRLKTRAPSHQKPHPQLPVSRLWRKGLAGMLSRSIFNACPREG